MNKAIKQLPAGAVEVEPIFHKRPLGKEEIETKMGEVLRNLNKIDLINEEVKAFVDEKKSDIKQISMENLSKRKMLQDGYEGQERDCYLMPDHAKNRMNFVDCETNEVLWERALFPKERQLFINNGSERTGTEE